MVQSQPIPHMNNQTIPLLTLLMAAASLQAAEPAAHRPATESMAYACAGCHGTNGHAIAPTPTIAGKPESDFVEAMLDFKSGKRESSIMNRIARAYTEEDIAALAHFFKKR